MRQEVKEVLQENKNKEDRESEVFGELVEVVSTKSTSLSLLTSKDRDFLQSPTGTQLWLSDKLNLLHPPVDGWNLFPRRIHQRGMRYPEMDIEEWYSFMQELQPDEIVWRCPWLDLEEMVVHSDGFDRVVIAGLTRFTFYIPGRILRITAGDFWIPNFNAQTLHGYDRHWELRARQAESPDFTPRLRNVYRQWLRADVQTRENID